MALPTEPDLPLADLKILDFSWVGVGPITVKYLADHDLRRVNPRLVMLSTCLQGQTGPHALFPGFGQLMAALSGFYEISGWPDRSPAPPYGAYTDFIVPRLAATALLAAIDHQRRTGEGQYLDVSQFEASLHFLAPALLAYELDGTIAGRAGNGSDHAAPHGA